MGGKGVGCPDVKVPGTFSDTVDVIGRVGPGGHYLDDPHTVAHFREEFLLDTRLDRQPFEAWQSAGAAPLSERLAAEVQRILGRR